MGYTTNVALSIPMGIIIYMLTEKMILSTVSDKNFDDKVQSNFIIAFVTGLAFIALAMSVFADNGVCDNQSIQLGMYGAGGFLVLNSVFFNWDVLDENTKIIILAIMISGMIIWSYTQKRTRGKTNSNKDNSNKDNKDNKESKKESKSMLNRLSKLDRLSNRNNSRATNSNRRYTIRKNR